MILATKPPPPTSLLGSLFPPNHYPVICARKISRADTARLSSAPQRVSHECIPSSMCSFVFPCVPLTLSPMLASPYPIFPAFELMDIAHPSDRNRPRGTPTTSAYLLPILRRRMTKFHVQFSKPQVAATIPWQLF